MATEITLQRVVAIHPQREQMQKEVQAFERLHGELVQEYLGQFVAIHEGNVIDNDTDIDEIIDRIESKYANKIVLVRKVEKNLPPEIRILSPLSPSRG